MGDESHILAHVDIAKVYSFHMTLSHSRDPFTCFTTSMDMATFWGITAALVAGPSGHGTTPSSPALARRRSRPIGHH